MNKDKLISEFNRAFHYKDPLSNKNLTTTIVNLIDMNHNFTFTDFDKFIEAVTQKKTQSYVSLPLWENHDDQDKVIKYMFTKFNPLNEQFDILTKCIRIRTNKPYNIWMDMLVEKGFKFSDNHITLLKTRKYDVSKLLIQDGSHINDIIEEISKILRNMGTINSLKELMSKYIDPYPENFMEMALHQMRYYLSHKKESIELILDLFISKGIKFTDECNSVIINPNIKHSACMLIDKGFIPNIELLTYFVKINDMSLLLYSIKKINPSTEIMNAILSHVSEWKGEITWLNKQYAPNKTTIKPLLNKYGYDETNILNVNGNLDIYKFFRSLNVIPDNATFEIACKIGNYDIFKNCIDEFKFVPSKYHLQLILQNVKQSNIINDILCYKIIPNHEEFEILIGKDWDSNIFELLVKYGLQIKNDNVYCALKKGIEINELERFGIEYDNQLYYHCHISGFLPKSYISKFKIDKGILGLRILCNTRETSIDVITSFMEKNNVKLDRYCMEHAARNNSQLLAYMINVLKLEITPTLMHWINYNANINDYYDLYIKKYNIDDNYLSEPFV